MLVCITLGIFLLISMSYLYIKDVNFKIEL